MTHHVIKESCQNFIVKISLFDKLTLPQRLNVETLSLCWRNMSLDKFFLFVLLFLILYLAILKDPIPIKIYIHVSKTFSHTLIF